MAKRTVEVTADELTRLITLVEVKREAIGKCPDPAIDYDAWRSYLQFGRGLIEELVSTEGAVYRARVGDACHLKLAGIKSSCTGGDFGLLRNWIAAAARRRVELQNGAAS